MLRWDARRYERENPTPREKPMDPKIDENGHGEIASEEEWAELEELAKAEEDTELDNLEWCGDYEEME